MHRARQGFVRARTAQANQIRRLLGEYGYSIPQGMAHMPQVFDVIEDAPNDLPGAFRQLILRLMDHLKVLHDRIKLLFWDKNGFWLLLKRLEADRFIWPRREQPMIELSVEQLGWLLDGINLDAMKRHPKRSYRRTG